MIYFNCHHVEREPEYFFPIWYIEPCTLKPHRVAAGDDEQLGGARAELAAGAVRGAGRAAVRPRLPRPAPLARFPLRLPSLPRYAGHRERPAGEPCAVAFISHIVLI